MIPYKDEPFYIDSATVRYLAVKPNGSGRATAVTATSDLVLGILQETVQAADVTGGVGRRTVSVRTHGTSIAQAGAAITVGLELKVTAGGQFIPVSAVSDFIAGRARSAAGAAGDWFEMDLYASRNGVA
jgi:hypothetical protein